MGRRRIYNRCNKEYRAKKVRKASCGTFDPKPRREQR